jgi:hypothetical protein
LKFPAEQFPNDLKTKLQDHYLRINRNKMTMNALELFVKHGLDMEEILIPLYNARTEAFNQKETRKSQEISAIAEDIKIIQKMVSIKLRAFERCFIYILIFLN